MADYHILTVGLLHKDELLIALSDGRSITLSLQKLLTLTPDSVETEEDATAEDV